MAKIPKSCHTFFISTDESFLVTDIIIYQKAQNSPLACDFTAISGSVGSTTGLANDFYVPDMFLNTT